MTKTELKKLARNKATQSNCVFAVSAIGLNKRGEVIGKATNRYRHPETDRGTIHAEAALIIRCGKALKTIIICRVGHGGDILPIHACEACSDLANRLGIKIQTVWEW